MTVVSNPRENESENVAGIENDGPATEVTLPIVGFKEVEWAIVVEGE